MTAATTAAVPEPILQAVGALEAAIQLLDNLGASGEAVDVLTQIVADAKIAVYGPEPEDDAGSDEWDADTFERAVRILKQISETGGAS